MNDSRDHLPPDLDWLAERFVLGDLPPPEEEAVAGRLPDDDALAAAVARASRLVAAVRAAALPARSAEAEPGPRAKHGLRQIRRPLLVAGATALAVTWVAWVASSRRPAGPPALPGSAAVVELWRNSAEAVAFDGEAPADDEDSADPDTVPGWMLAAVSLDATADGVPEVLEN